MNLNAPYFIDTRIEQLIEDSIDPDTGEIRDDEFETKLKSLEADKNDAIEAIGLYYKDVVAAAKATKDEKERLQEQQNALENRADKIKNQLSRILAGEKFKTPRISISYKNSEKTIVDDETKLPYEYLKWEKPKPNKTAIKNAIKDGLEVPGAHLEPNTSTIIR